MITTENNDAAKPASKKACACIEGCDARDCLKRRSPILQHMDELELYIADEKCECHCHVEEADEYREDWEDRP